MRALPLILLLMILYLSGLWYVKSSIQAPKKDVEREQAYESYRNLLSRLDKRQQLDKQDVISGANTLSNFLCTDESFQTSSGRTVDDCLEKYRRYQETCQRQIFNGAPEKFEDKENVVNFVKRYMKCVGVN